MEILNARLIIRSYHLSNIIVYVYELVDYYFLGWSHHFGRENLIRELIDLSEHFNKIKGLFIYIYKETKDTKTDNLIR